MIAITVAMQKELDLLLGIAQDIQTVTDGRYTFYTGTVAGRTVVMMQCGIGKVNAALSTDALIRKYHPSLVINSGVAGGTGSEAGILDVVLGSAVAYHDVWCGPDTEWGEASGCPRMFACPPAVLEMAPKIGAKTGLIASGDIFVTRPQDVARILALYPQAMAVDMESAAVAQACYLAGVPMACLRVVSDTPGQADNIAQYENFWDDAPRHTFQAVRALISML